MSERKRSARRDRDYKLCEKLREIELYSTGLWNHIVEDDAIPERFTNKLLLRI
jgi:hypothetical protein